MHLRPTGPEDSPGGAAERPRREIPRRPSAAISRIRLASPIPLHIRWAPGQPTLIRHSRCAREHLVRYVDGARGPVTLPIPKPTVGGRISQHALRDPVSAWFTPTPLVFRFLAFASVFICVHLLCQKSSTCSLNCSEFSLQSAIRGRLEGAHKYFVRRCLGCLRPTNCGRRTILRQQDERRGPSPPRTASLGTQNRSQTTLSDETELIRDLVQEHPAYPHHQPSGNSYNRSLGTRSTRDPVVDLVQSWIFMDKSPRSLHQ